MDLTMTEPAGTISQDGLAELQQKFSEIKRSINNALAVMMAPPPAGLCRETGDDGYGSFDERAADCFELAGVHAGAERKSWSQAGSRGRRESVAQSRDSRLFPKSSGCAERLVLELIHERH